MTYIIGTVFNVTKKVLKPGITSSSERVTSNTPFLPPGEYTISYIKRNKDNVIYTFINENLEQVDVEFENINQADRYISAMRNEQLPDYASIYKRLS